MNAEVWDRIAARELPEDLDVTPTRWTYVPGGPTEADLRLIRRGQRQA